MSNQRTDQADPRRKWIVATCVALVLAAVGDAGPEIIESGSLVAGYDGPGPLIYRGVAAVVASVRWRFVPLLAVAMAAFFPGHAGTVAGNVVMVLGLAVAAVTGVVALVVGRRSRALISETG